MKLRTLPNRGTQAGFTLVEILAVIVILSILMSVLVFSLGNAQQTSNAKLTEARMTSIGAALGTYEGDMGDYPMSHFADVSTSSASATNQGIEALVQALWKEPLFGLGLSDDLLANVDGDRANSEPLLEIIDMWGNPIAYFHRTDYGQFQTYMTEDGETGEKVESDVVARRHPVTGRWANHQKFQLISAGEDGRFGTDDDLCNFKTD
ncbi:MAG: prepilin-type N-terminal cleavage/methylation domain-containing protein [Bacteroidia bacterium]|jgi:prepilin-type N-terminal cleavage/methylation domain-containing protein